MRLTLSRPDDPTIFDHRRPDRRSVDHYRTNSLSNIENDVIEVRGKALEAEPLTALVGAEALIRRQSPGSDPVAAMPRKMSGADVVPDPELVKKQLHAQVELSPRRCVGNRARFDYDRRRAQTVAAAVPLAQLR